MDIFWADIGSVKQDHFGWFVRLGDRTTAEGTDVAALSTMLANRLNTGGCVALGFEAPMFVPLRTDPRTLTERHVGESELDWRARRRSPGHSARAGPVDST
jgi:hypothetical protein